MNRSEAYRALDRFFAEASKTIGFKRIKTLLYFRKYDGATGYLDIRCRIDPRGYAAFNCFVAVRIESLMPWLDETNDKLCISFGIPIHLLRENAIFTEWQFSNAAELNGLQNVVIDNLNCYAVPFIERYSQVSNVHKAVESPVYSNWINLGLDPERRVRVLASIQMAKGDKANALKTLDDALLERKNVANKYRFDIERMRRRILEAGQGPGVTVSGADKGADKGRSTYGTPPAYEAEISDV